MMQKRAQTSSKEERERIDRHLWDLFGETWCVMHTDLRGFSRGVADFCIADFLQTIYESVRLLTPLVEEDDGILLKLHDDSFEIIFRNVNKAMHCAIQMQKNVKKHNHNLEDREKVLLSIALGYGHVLRIGDKNVFGEEVNATHRMAEAMAKGGEILVTKAVMERAYEFSDVIFDQIQDVYPGTSAYRVIYDK
jgi:class 3 adenylate cyclase